MFNFNTPNPNLGIFFLILWEAFWKGAGLWKAAKRGDLWWFIPIFLINFFGILPIFYLWRIKELNKVVKDTLKFLRLKH